MLLNTTVPGATMPTFASRTSFAVGSDPIGLAVGDFNGDGKADLAITNKNSNSVSVLFNTTATGAASPTFAGQVTFGTGTTPISVTAGDFNGDGKLDLAVVNLSSGNVSVFLNTTATGAASPSFAPSTVFSVGSDPVALTAADLNGDGKLDLAVTNYGSNNVSVLFNTTATGAAPRLPSPLKRPSRWG